VILSESFPPKTTTDGSAAGRKMNIIVISMFLIG
jgi:hypothetical protein